MKNVKLIEFDTIEDANTWLEQHRDTEIKDIKYAASVTETKLVTKILIILEGVQNG